MNSITRQHNSTGLDLEGLTDLASMLDAPTEAGGYKMYDVDHIEEDPANFRSATNPGFSGESIEALAETILARVREGKRGLIQPISLRPHPDLPGRYIINHGHRRYRATACAGLKQIAANLDPEFSKRDQMLENIQHEQLTVREIADYIGTELSQGQTQADLARTLGKSKAWVSMHAAMLNLPEPVAEAVANGQVSDVTLAKELVVAHAAAPEAVKQFLESSEGKINRSQVKKLREVTRRGTPEVGQPSKAAPQSDTVVGGDNESDDDEVQSSSSAGGPGRKQCPEANGTCLYAEVRRSSKYADQAGRGELFPVRIIHGEPLGYVICGGPGGQYRLKDVWLWAVDSDSQRRTRLT
jgi:ParB family chromosome partitioning protein